ncbi:MAG: AraC family transcriptional regulator [Flavobacteriaceae bacterium]|nr:MAG: AraC family transcriptional regulator [Flavobacteriaceae bacterium]
MILDYKSIDLFGKMVFEKAIITPPFKKLIPMNNEACFLYVIEGESNSVAENGSIKIKAEDAVLMKCGQYLARVDTSKSEKYHALAVHFYPEVLQKIYEDKLPKFLTEPEASSIGIVKFISDELIRKYIDSVLFYFENPNLVNEEILVLKVKEIILLLNQTQNAPVIKQILSNLFNPTTYSFREIIESHLYTNITVADLAGLTNTSLSSFKREFNKVYKESPATYIRNKKLKKSLNLLMSSALRTTDIAFDCGFYDVSHFSRSFKQKYGSSPTSYKMDHFSKTLNQP